MIFFILIQSRNGSYQALFLRKQRIFPVFADKLGHFKADAFFPYVTNTQAYHQKSETRKNESLVRLTPELPSEGNHITSI